MTQRRRSPGWLVPAIVVLVSYNTWMLWSPMNGRAAILDGYLSELAAADQPHHLFFRGGDMITGLVVTAMAVCWLRRWAATADRSRRWWLVSGLALIVFAVCTLLDAFFAMDCSPTLSATCRAAEEAGELSVAHSLHLVTSVTAQAGIVTSMIAAVLATRSARRSVRSVVSGLAALEVAALIAMMIMVTVGVPGIGYPQMIMVVVAAVWCMVVGLDLGGFIHWGGAHEPRR